MKQTEAFLVGDIGATNARLSLAHLPAGAKSAAAVTLSYTDVLPVADQTSAPALIEAYLARQPELDTAGLAGACLALAGPREQADGDSSVQLVNAPLNFVQSALAAQLGCPVSLMHDFSAIAGAIATYDDATLTALHRLGDAGPAAGPRAVLGPGTGLGVGGLLPTASGWEILASEGGHAGLAPADPLEAEVLGILLREYEYVCWETVLSGPGLMRLYGAVCELWACRQEVSAPSDLLAAAVDELEPVCHQTLELFCSLLGSAAASLVLTLGARGGLFLAGGVLPRMQGFLQESQFRTRFDERGPLSGYCQRVPVYLLDDPWVGLRGAALRATQVI